MPALDLANCCAPFDACDCNDCTRTNLTVITWQGLYIREDVAEAVVDAVALRNNPPAMVDVFEDWNALGVSDPVTLPPLELRF